VSKILFPGQDSSAGWNFIFQQSKTESNLNTEPLVPPSILKFRAQEELFSFDLDTTITENNSRGSFHDNPLDFRCRDGIRAGPVEQSALECGIISDKSPLQADKEIALEILVVPLNVQGAF
jgi:hypothetical protein